MPKLRLGAFEGPVSLGLTVVLLTVSVAYLVPLSGASATPVSPVPPGEKTGGTGNLAAGAVHIPPASSAPVRGTNSEEPSASDAVNPLLYYTAQPAPMGMADYGVTVGGSPYTYNSSEFLANFSWAGIAVHGSDGNPPSDTSVSVQLNVVLVFVKGGTTYSFWIQDVAVLNSTTLQVSFLDNVWNFSALDGCVATSAVTGNGSVVPDECYYFDRAGSQRGASRVMSTPGDFALLVRSYRTAGGAPEVAFGYWDGLAGGFVTFDNVIWPWASTASSDRNFVVDGSNYTPAGAFYDAEVALGGSGGGSSVAAQNFTDTSIRLFYWNGHNFQAPRSAWNFGSNTGETISNVQSIWRSTYTSAADGTPLLVQLNGTTLDAGLENVYNQSSVGYLNVSAPGVSAGDVVVGSTNWSFVGGEANITLTPGTYPVWVDSSAGTDDLGECSINGGATTETAVGPGCRPTASVPVATPRSADVGQSATISTTLTSAGTGGDTFSWNVSPNTLGCASSTSDTLRCVPTTPGTYAIEVTVTDSYNESMTTGTLGFVVFADPTVALRVSRSPIDAGQETTFLATASGGSSGYTYSWSGLPPGCTALAEANLTCTPTAGGTFSLWVNVTDSNGWAAVANASAVVYPHLVVTGIRTSPTPVVSGTGMELSVNVSGGRGPYNFSYFGLPPGCGSADLSVLTCTPHQSGTFEILVQVGDADGAVANGTAEIAVVERAPGASMLPWYEVVALLVTSVGAAAAVVGSLRRKRGRR